MGKRSSDPEKYKKDAELLKQQFFDTLIDDPDELNSRSVFYTAQSYFDYNNYNKAAEWYSLYLKLKKSWIEEIFESNCRLGFCMQKLKNNSSAINYYNKAIEIFPDRAEPYFALGEMHLKEENYAKSYNYLKIANNKKHEDVKDKYSLFIDELCYGDNVNNILQDCKLRLRTDGNSNN